MSKNYWLTLKLSDGSSRTSFICTADIEKKTEEKKSFYNWRGSKKKVVSVSIDTYAK